MLSCLCSVDNYSFVNCHVSFLMLVVLGFLLLPVVIGTREVRLLQLECSLQPSIHTGLAVQCASHLV